MVFRIGPRTTLAFSAVLIEGMMERFARFLAVCLLLAACSTGTVPTSVPTTTPAAAQSATPGASTTTAPTATGTSTATPQVTVAPTDTPSPSGSPVTITGATAISVGWYHVCVLVGGGAKCWGHNGAGQLGDGLDVPLPDCIPECDTDILPGATVPLPQSLTGLQGDATSISAGGYHTCAVTTGQGAVCWGYNFDGQLGDGTEPCADCEGGFGGPFVSNPLEVVGLRSGVDAIAAADSFSCALTSTGGVQCWGRNNSGELGDGTTTDSPTPVAVSGMSSGVAAFASGSYDTCVLTNSGGAKCWGVSGFGQLGDGTTDSSSTPVDVTGLASGVTAIATGEYHTCAVDAAGGIKCWGTNYDGELGDGSTTDSSVPVGVEGLDGRQVAVAAGTSYSCALSAVGAVKCWGANYYHQLGDGTSDSSSTPVDVPGLPSDVIAIDAGRDSTCALTATGRVWCWGDNAFGQLGDGTTLERPFSVEALLSGTASAEPQAVTQAFYDWYLAATNSGDRDLHGRADLTPEFIDSYYVLGFPYDPVLCGQDVPEWASAREATIDGDTATLIVTESWSEPGTGVPVDLVLSVSGWQISAIDCLG